MKKNLIKVRINLKKKKKYSKKLEQVFFYFKTYVVANWLYLKYLIKQNKSKIKKKSGNYNF